MSINQLIFKEELPIPEDINVDIDDNYLVKIQGPKGEIVKDFSPRKLNISKNKYKIYKENNKIIIEVYIKGKRGKSLLYTLASKIKNSIKGVIEGYVYKLKIVHTHFPINVKVKGDTVYIENFIGERSPRVAKILGKYTQVKVEGEDVIISGIDKDEVSQTAFNIQLATKIKDKDPRKFLDGIYVYYRGK
ncbi:MAG: 50S ribosomal protein L6 [Thermoproteota archaeon]|jgi:large subunit ribosomal protein L6|nr:50S ribosomal protein L6 [Thermoproteota archaeon]